MYSEVLKIRCKCVNRIKVAILLILLPGSVCAEDMDIKHFPYPPDGAYIMEGWDSQTSKPKSAICVSAQEYTDTGQSRNIKYSVVTDTSSLMSAMNVSAQAKVDAIAGSGSASITLANSVKIDNYGLNMIVTVDIPEGVSYLKPTKQPDENGDGISIVLKEKPLKMVEKDPLEFSKLCGDSFIANTRRSTQLQGIYTFHTHSDEEKKSSEAELRAQFGTGSANISASQKIESLIKDSKLNVQYTQIGGSGLKIATTEEGFIAAIQNLGQTADRKSVV